MAEDREVATEVRSREQRSISHTKQLVAGAVLQSENYVVLSKVQNCGTLRTSNLRRLRLQTQD